MGHIYTPNTSKDLGKHGNALVANQWRKEASSKSKAIHAKMGEKKQRVSHMGGFDKNGDLTHSK